MNQGQIVGPAMLFNIVMRWPRATPMLLLSGYAAAAFAGVAPIPTAVVDIVHVTEHAVKTAITP